MPDNILKYRRYSYLEKGDIFFWTATINGWQNLLFEDQYKAVIISSFNHLSQKGKLDIFAFVIMPNHIRLIWRINEHNGKESTQGSFLKFTAHEFKKLLTSVSLKELSNYRVNASDKNFEFWQRDPMAIHLYSSKVAFQKLDYIHLNPLTDQWQLVSNPCQYKYSSARFYEYGDTTDFPFLKDLRNEF